MKEVTRGAVNAEIILGLQGGELITAIITNTSADSLELVQRQKSICHREGVRSNDRQRPWSSAKLSARNILAGEVAHVTAGAVNSEVVVRLPGGTEIVASITRASVEALELKNGDQVSAVVKASNVLIGV